MEADWSVALAADDPVITVPWATSSDDPRKCRFVDLRLGGHLIDEIEEARSRPALRSALLAAERRHVTALDSEVRCLDQQRGGGC